MKLLKETILEYREGTSDKVYEVRTFIESAAGYSVECTYGRRGAVNRKANKGVFSTFGEAYKVHELTVGEKLRKGYKITSLLIDTPAGGLAPDLVEEVVESSAPLVCSDDQREKALARLRGCA